MKISALKAEDILLKDLTQYENAVSTNVKVALKDNQFAALVSFTYNVGIGNFLKSTLLKKLNKGGYSSVPSELMKWTKAGGKSLQGLSNRRSAEAGLWAKGDFVSSNYIKPSVTKNSITDKLEVVAPVVGAASGLTGFATGSGPFQWAFAIAMLATLGVGLWFVVRRIKAEKM